MKTTVRAQLLNQTLRDVADVGAALAQCFNFADVDIDADHLQPRFTELDSQRQSHVAETEDGDTGDGRTCGDGRVD